MEGWIKLHRKFLEWEWYHDKNTSRLYLHIMLNAVFKKCRFAGRELCPGQYVTSYRRLAADTGLTVDELRTAIKKLRTTGEITTQTNNKYTVITIVNYGLYQQEGQTENPSKSPTNTEQDPSRSQAKGEQTANKTQAEPIYNNNINNLKTDKENNTEIIDYRGRHYRYNKNYKFDAGMKAKIIENTSEIFYNTYIADNGRFDIFQLRRLLQKPEIMDILINHDYFLPA